MRTVLTIALAATMASVSFVANAARVSAPTAPIAPVVEAVPAIETPEIEQAVPVMVEPRAPHPIDVAIPPIEVAVPKIEIDAEAILSDVENALDRARIVLAQASQAAVLAPVGNVSLDYSFFRGDNSPLFLRTGGRTDQEAAEIAADMAVMAKILERKLLEAALAALNGWWSNGGAGIRQIYMGHDGVVFAFDVPFPLVPPKRSSEDADSDEVWERTIQELWGSELKPGSSRAYVAADVDLLKQTIRSALPHARNIRNLLPDSMMTVIVFGAGVNLSEDKLALVGEWAQQPSPASMLTIRARMDDLSNPTERLDAAGESATTEDVAVMSRILHKSLSRALGDRYGNARPWFNNARGIGNGVQGLHIAGSGALFLAEATFPVVAIEKVSGDHKSESGDDVWEQAKREAFGGARLPMNPGPVFGLKNAGPSFGLNTARAMDPADHAGLLNQLTDAVIDSLKYASNIREIGRDESVVVAVRGAAAPDRWPGRSVHETSTDDAYSSYVVVVGQRNSSDNTLIAFRALKRDIDDYAAGALSRDAFAEKVERVSSYGLGNASREAFADPVPSR